MMYPEEKLAIAISCSVALLGFVTEFFWKCYDTFSRSGSLIVCVSIYFMYTKLNLVPGNFFKTAAANLERNRLETDIVHSDSALKNKVRGSTDASIQKEANKKEVGDRRVALVEALILAVGTLIWGFGDLFFCSY